MHSKTWLKFTWALGEIPAPNDAEFLPMQKRAVRAEEESSVIDVLSKSTAMDSSLGEAGRVLQHYFNALAPRLWKMKDHRSLGIYHGERIIGASVFLVKAEAEIHLASGPCVLHEYRNRHLGTWLLQSSLYELQEAGLSTATGVCKCHSVLAKYLYPKFGSTSEPCEFHAEKH